MKTLTEEQKKDLVSNGFTKRDIERGYIQINAELDLIMIQTIDELEGTDLQKFKNDKEAGRQAELDGIKMLDLKHEQFKELYIVANAYNRKILMKHNIEFDNGG